MNADEREILELARQSNAEVGALLDLLAEPAEAEPALTLYSMRDPRWRYEQYTPGYTFGGSGCLVTCYTMIASYAGYTDTPLEFAAKMRAQNAFLDGDLAHPQRIPNAYPKTRWDGFVTHWRVVPADLEKLAQYLDECPTIIETEFVPGGAQPPADQHFVVALDFTEDGEDLWIADPWDGTETLLLERYALSHWDLARAIYGARLLRVSNG